MDMPAPVHQTIDDRAQTYDKMGDMLAYLSQHWHTHPRLDVLARKMGHSTAHFQKLFTQWAGVSPKTVINSLTHTHAKMALFDGASVEEATDHVGLSSPSRLYDLCIAHEGITPGTARNRAKGVDMRTGVAPCPFGQAVVILAPQGIAALGFADVGQEDASMADLKSRFPLANFTTDQTAVRDAVEQMFAVGRPRINMALYGTAFHLQVWKALLAIPPGATTTYGAIAKAIGNPKANRAVGAAVGANPISWLIPCHRALASNGKLNGYHWGLRRKAAMLGYENVSLAE